MAMFIKKDVLYVTFVDVLIQSGYAVEIKNHSEDYYEVEIKIDTEVEI